MFHIFFSNVDDYVSVFGVHVTSMLVWIALYVHPNQIDYLFIAIVKALQVKKR